MVTVNVLGNTVVEPNETFFVKLSNAVGATIFDNQGVGTILNDDGPVLRINDLSKAEEQWDDGIHIHGNVDPSECKYGDSEQYYSQRHRRTGE